MGKGKNFFEQMGELFDGDLNMTGHLEFGGPVCEIGPEGDLSCTKFEDENASSDSPKNVIGFKIRSGDIVDGICTLFDGKVSGNQHGSSYGGKESVVTLEKEDFIIRVEGKKGIRFAGGNAIGDLKYFTKKGRVYGPFGRRKDGQSFSLQVPENLRVLGFCGTVNSGGNGGFLTGIGFVAKTWNANSHR